MIDDTSIGNLNAFNNLNFVGGDLEFTYNSSLSDYCGLNSLFQNNGLTGEFYAGWNSFNPTQTDMESGNCN